MPRATNAFFFALILTLGALASQVAAHTLQDVAMHEMHEQWMARYGRLYENSQEKEKCLKILKENVALIESFNDFGNKPYKLGGHECSTKTSSFKYQNATGLPSSMDWRKKGAVTPIKDQGQCGCCWAFSAVAAMEGITKLKSGKLICLSEQELVDCDIKGVDQGCSGGLMDNVFQFIQNNHGVDGICNTKGEANHAANVNGYKDVPANSEKALLKVVANQPVFVAIDAGGSDFQFYSSGIFTLDCGISLDHGVTAVGYWVTNDGTKYWLVKNSWVTEWGEEGYIRMQRRPMWCS
ncbi:hypothetical protein I3843_03G193900 [Carya illinoinensis]|nr:hypothetical protein I3760_03G196600 [Carya illinoinensis]KAG7988576.1 hypothetical protein I3843_03G193900 [Carya illinoinensis]